VAEVRAGRPILKPVYRHQDGTFGPPVYVLPRRFTIVEGLLGCHTRTLRDARVDRSAAEPDPVSAA
jgi:phosphoribulokinase